MVARQQLGGSLDDAERSAELVADHADEAGLEPVELAFGIQSGAEILLGSPQLGRPPGHPFLQDLVEPAHGLLRLLQLGDVVVDDHDLLEKSIGGDDREQGAADPADLLRVAAHRERHRRHKDHLSLKGLADVVDGAGLDKIRRLQDVESETLLGRKAEKVLPSPVEADGLTLRIENLDAQRTLLKEQFPTQVARGGGKVGDGVGGNFHGRPPVRQCPRQGRRCREAIPRPAGEWGHQSALTCG